MAAWLAWPLWAVCLLLALLNLVLNIVEPASLDPLLPRPFPPPVAVQFALTLMAFPTVGALIDSRQPSNPIGWLICGMGVTEALRGTAGSYARYAVLARPGSLPAGEWVAWFGHVASGPTVGLLVMALLLFPDGTLVSRRLQPVAWLLVGACAAAALVNGLLPENPSSMAGIARPVSVAGPTGEVLQVLSRGLNLLQVALLLAAGLSLVVRFRREHGPERQQIKWVALAGVFAAVAIGGFWLPGGWSWATTLGDWEYLAVVPYSLAIIGIPAAIGVAIVCYRLYDIDRLISRTITYGVLWLGIALAYVGLSVALGLAASERAASGTGNRLHDHRHPAGPARTAAARAAGRPMGLRRAAERV